MIRLYIVTLFAIKSVIGLTCYCNLPSCISSGFTCLTTGPGRCFFYIEESSRITVHGCTHLPEIGTQNLRCDYLQPYQTFKELLFQIKQKQKHMKENPDKVLIPPPAPVIGCCQKNTCNHPDYTKSIEQKLKSIPILSHHKDSQSTSSKDSSSKNCATTSNNLYTDQEVWFRAAVIAVPISGGFIMIILIFIAIRLLKREDLNYKLSQQYKAACDMERHESPIKPNDHPESGQERLSDMNQSGGEYLLGKHMKNTNREVKSGYSNSFPYSEMTQNVKAI